MNLILSRLRPYFETLMFAGAQFLYWSANCALYSFIVLYLKDQGYSDSMCGIISGMLACMGILIHPILGYVSDIYIPAKKIIIICFIVAIPLTQILPFIASMAILFIIVLVMLSFFDYYQYSLLDSWIVKLQMRGYAVEFARIRSFASLGYGVSSYIVGLLITNFGFNIMFYMHSIFLILTILFLLPMPEVPCVDKTEKGAKKISFKDASQILFKIKRYRSLLICGALYQFTTRPSITFLGLFIDNAGGDSSDLGLALLIGAGLEFPIMIIVAIISQKTKKSYLLITAMLTLAMRVVGFAIAMPIPYMLAMQAFGAIGFGLYNAMFVQYIAEITPSELTATATTLGTAMTFSTGAVLGMFFGGFIADAIGLLGYGAVCAAAGFLGTVLFIPNVIWDIKNKDKALLD